MPTLSRITRREAMAEYGGGLLASATARKASPDKAVDTEQSVRIGAHPDASATLQ